MIPKIFYQFVCKQQIEELEKREEEKEIKDKINKFEKIFNDMPIVNEQYGNKNNAVIYLHYFKNLPSSLTIINWYIIEKDNKENQTEAFGMYNLEETFESGYISIKELIKDNIKLNFEWKFKIVNEIKKNNL
jgi:hypothetical protein